MNLPAEISIFAVAFAVNLVHFGALLSGGLAVTLRFSENASPRLRYLASIIVFLMAIFVPLVATFLANSAEQKNIDVYVELTKDQINESEETAQPHHLLIDKSANADLPPTPEINKNLVNHFVSIVANSSAGSVFCVIWFLGSFLLGLRELIGMRQLNLSKKYWMRVSAVQQDELGCPRNAPLYLADDQTPGTSGWLRPKIVLPREFPIGISLESKRFIIRHELSHARWRDPLVRFLLRAIRNLLWISPALWLIERLIRAECEAAADRSAINSSAENRNYQLSAMDYAETLLLIAKSLKPTGCRKRQSQLIGIGTEGDLEIRIRRLLSSCRVTRRQIGAAICACLTTALTTTLIPSASFSEVFQAVDTQAFFATDSRNVFPIAGIENLAGNTDPVILMQSESGGDHDLVRWQKPRLNSVNTNRGLAEKTSVAGLHAERDDPPGLKPGGDDNSAEPIRMLNDEDIRETEASAPSRAAFGSPQTLENSSATNTISRKTNRPEYFDPARRSPPILSKSVKLMEGKIDDASAARDTSSQVPASALPARREANYTNYLPARASTPAAISPLTKPNVIRSAPFSGFRQLSGFRGMKPPPAQPSEP